MSIKSKLLSAAAIILAACNNTPKEPEAQERKSTVGSVDTAHYKKLASEKFIFEATAYQYWDKTPTELNITKRNILLSDTTIYAAAVAFKPTLGNNFYGLTALIDGNAFYLQSHDSSMVISNNEKNVQIAVDSFLHTITKYQSLCKKDDTYYSIDTQDKIVFTIFTTKGKYVCIEKVDNYTNPVWQQVMDKMNAVAKALSDNYKVATGK